jgi:surface polysaccharide O-acyltransferase-like enzyme
MAAAGQYVTIAGIYIYAPTAAVPVPAYPASYVYRTGMCLLLAALAYWWCQRFPKPRFSPLRLLGQASMLVYFVHLELVYGRPSWPLLQHLHPIPASLLVLTLTVLMVALAWWRIEIFGKRPRPVAAAAAAVKS